MTNPDDISTALTPAEIVAELDRHIIGQHQAKRAVAVALRNRWRRRMLDQAMQDEVTPRNILMIGPTGVGKTEIARRLARLAGAPFIKIEASKFTEVGYVGRDVESIIRDLADESLRLVREQAMARVRERSRKAAVDRLLGLVDPTLAPGAASWAEASEKLLAGEFDNQDVEIEIDDSPRMPVEIMGMGPGMEEMERNFRDMLGNLMPKKRKRTKMSVRNALAYLEEEEASRLIDEDDLKRRAADLLQNHGIVFLDEVDKVARTGASKHGPDVGGEGVQRDLLPIVEGSTVSTKLGQMSTDHILFIAAGAFHVSKPSDLIPELQGRFPIRVELDPLTEEDLYRILTEPECSLLKQAAALLGTEGVTIEFDDSGVREIAGLSAEYNRSLENIGARRLHTVVERVAEEISFSAPDLRGQTIPITAEYVRERMREITQDQNLARYIL